MDEKEYLKQMGSLPKVKAPEDFLKKVHERIERRSAFEKIMHTLFVPVKIKVPLEVAAMAAAIMLIVGTSSVKKPVEQLTYTYTGKTQAVGAVLMKNEPLADKKMVAAEGGRRDADMAFASKPVELALVISPAALDKMEVAGLKEKVFEEKRVESEKAPYSGDAISKVENQIKLAQGKVINVKTDKDTGAPRYIDAEIPAAGYAEFAQALGKIGVLRGPILRQYPQGPGTVRVRITLIAE